MLFHRWSHFSQAISFAFYFFQPNKLGLGEPTQGLSPATDGSNLSPSPHPHPSLSSPHEIPLPPVPAAPLADATGEHPAACRHTERLSCCSARTLLCPGREGPVLPLPFRLTPTIPAAPELRCDGLR
jgi:hypothetical protein